MQKIPEKLCQLKMAILCLHCYCKLASDFARRQELVQTSAVTFIYKYKLVIDNVRTIPHCCTHW